MTWSSGVIRRVAGEFRRLQGSGYLPGVINHEFSGGQARHVIVFFSGRLGLPTPLLSFAGDPPLLDPLSPYSCGRAALEEV